MIYNEAECKVVIQTSESTYKKMLDMGKVNIGYKRCKIVEGKDVLLRCFNCSGFSHTTL